MAHVTFIWRHSITKCLRKGAFSGALRNMLQHWSAAR